MGHAAATARTSVLKTAASTLAAVEDVRSLGNALATEQGAIKARLDAAEQQQRELAAALELNLAVIRAKAAKLDADKADHDAMMAQIGNLDRGVSFAVEPLGRGFLGRLRWLVMGR